MRLAGLAPAAPAATATQGRAKEAQSAYIGASKARDIALKDAGVSKRECRYVDVQLDLDRDDGPVHYDVEFKVGTREYEYDINAVTGEVMSRSVEIDD